MYSFLLLPDSADLCSNVIAILDVPIKLLGVHAHTILGV